MSQRIVHLCYAGTSGSASTAVNIAAGSADPTRHAYVFYGACAMRVDYGAQLDALGCEWTYVHKPRGWLSGAYKSVAAAMLRYGPAAAVFHGSRSLGVLWSFGTKAASVPRIAVQHGPAREITTWWRRRACFWFSRMADRTVTVSDGMAELIGARAALALACEPLTVIPNGIDVDYWRADPPDIPADGPVRLVMVATLDSHKDHATLLRAVGLLRRAGRLVTCELVGDGPLANKLRALARKLGITDAVIFAGDVDRRAVREALHRGHILCHATGSESFGLAVVEAMAAARPVVASDVVVVREIIETGRTGMLVQPGDPGAMADAVSAMLDRPDEARAMASAGRQTARERYGHATMASAYEALVDELLAAGVGRRRR